MSSSGAWTSPRSGISGETSTSYPCAVRTSAARRDASSPAIRGVECRRARANVMELEVLDVDPLPAPSACMIAARIPAPSATRTWTRKSSDGVLERVAQELLAASSPASPIQRARKPASPRSSAVSSCSTRRRCSAERAADLVARSRGRCRPRCAGSRRRRASSRGTTRPQPRAGRGPRSARRRPGSAAGSRARAGGG